MSAKDQGVNDRQRRFCEYIVRGMPAGRAYERAGYDAKADAADAAAARMLGNAKVSRYLAVLRAEAQANAGMDRDGLVQFLVNVIKTPVGSVNAESELCQEWRIDEKGMSIKMPNKLAAAKQLAEIFGWSKPPDTPPVPVEIKVTIGGDV